MGTKPIDRWARLVTAAAEACAAHLERPVSLRAFLVAHAPGRDVTPILERARERMETAHRRGVPTLMRAEGDDLLVLPEAELRAREDAA